MAASVDKMVADQGFVGARPPQGDAESSAKREGRKRSCRRIALRDKFAQRACCSLSWLRFACCCFAIAYIVVSGAGKLFDVSFLTASPKAIQRRRRHWPRAVQLVLLLVLTLLISVPYRAWRR